MRVLTEWAGPAVDAIAAAAPGTTVVAVPPGEPRDDVRGDVLLAAVASDELVAFVEAAGVRWVHLSSTGIDKVPRGLWQDDRVVTCSRGASAVPIAEWVLAMMLAHEKQLPHAWVTEPPASWHLHVSLGELAGKTLGLIGVGGIGTAVIARARPFGMDIVATRRHPQHPVDGVRVTGDADDVLAVADHLVLAAPATVATRHLIDDRALHRVKPGVHLVNIARGSLVDQDALRAALDDGRVAAASLDTVDPEPLPEGHWLYTHPRVRLSPHVSWSSPLAFERLLAIFLENLRRFADGQPLLGVTDPDEGY